MTSRARQVLRGGISLVCCLGGAVIGYAGSPSHGHIPSSPHIVWLHTLAACLLGGVVPWLFASYFASTTRKRFINIELVVSLSMFLLLAVRLPFAIQEGNAIRGRFRAKVHSWSLEPPSQNAEGPDLPAGE
ncbi:MAG: hypothetical protein IH991_02090 [Planctomycetes bacterium]|nr:hypothetical protein [Planctomycetota bacterium]